MVATVVGLLFLLFLTLFKPAHARPCEDAMKPFFKPGSSSKIRCSSTTAKRLCTGGANIDSIVDFMCPKTCGKCTSGNDFPCMDAPSPARFGRTKTGMLKTCAWLRSKNGRECSRSGTIKKLADAACPKTCGICKGGGGREPVVKPEKPVTTKPIKPTKPFIVNGGQAGDKKKHPRAQIMLYWDEKFLWQGTTKQRSWCMECRRNCPAKGGQTLRNPSKGCRRGDSVTIAECDENNRNQWWIWDHGKIKAYSDDDLCVDFGHDWYFELQTCSSSDSKQAFATDDGFNTKGNDGKYRFEVYAKGKEKKQCMTQEHHPKCGEMLLHQPCFRPRNHKTSYWVAESPPSLCGHYNNGRC